MCTMCVSSPDAPLAQQQAGHLRALAHYTKHCFLIWKPAFCCMLTAQIKDLKKGLEKFDKRDKLCA